MFKVIKKTLVCGQEWMAYQVESNEKITVEDVKNELGQDALAFGFRCWNDSNKYKAVWTEKADEETIEKYRNHTHKYGYGETVGRCLTRYTCQICGSYYEIDSGD